MKLILVRHAESFGSSDGDTIALGTNRSLSPRGKVEAAELARDLTSRFTLSAVYSSPLRRALETARAIAAATAVEPNVVDELREMDHGIDGAVPEGASERIAADPASWTTGDDGRLKLIGGSEYFDEVQARAFTALEEIRAKHGIDDVIVVVSHGLTLHAVLCRVLGIPLSEWQRFRLNRASMSTIDYRANGRTLVTGINETCHLASPG